jgi:hypothetical protein
MFLLSLKNRREDGVYAVDDKNGNLVLFLFEDEDDATRYAMMLEEDENKEMIVIEIDDDLALKTCRMNNYKYTVITPNDIIIPPKTKK